ncbi:MAG: helix-turn-helix domain-containing protein [Candidatus Thermoplasmatota archaeon]|nr:helix-turn-helix domain-containing protein [Candidatus Thermoplasmatota archaeon]
MIKTLKVRLYPDDQQMVLLEKHLGACCRVGNHFPEIRTKYFTEHKHDKKKGLTAFDTMKTLTVLKREVPWLNEINSQSLKHSLARLVMAFKSCFRKNTGYPDFCSGKHNRYFIIPSGIQNRRKQTTEDMILLQLLSTIL